MWNGARPLRVIALVVLSVLSLSDVAFGRIRWAERDGKPVFLHPRRLGQQYPPVIDKISAACSGAVCGKLGGGAIAPLLALQPECSQQDFADSIINASRQFDAATQANMISLAKEYRQAEKNTPLDFTTNPPTNRNSVYCQKAPANPELIGLVQAQDPANDPNVFFDPALQKSVRKGSQSNTEPFGGAAAFSNNKNPIFTSPFPSNVASSTSSSPSPSTPAAAGSTPAPTPAAPAEIIGNFGSCSVPQIEFGAGFDNRKETSFEPVDKKSYNHGSAQNIDIISQFMCDTLVNSCGADQTARTTCASAKAAADKHTAKTGTQADAFNAVFGIKTNFSGITALDDQGNPVTDSGPVSSPSPSTSGPQAANFGKCSTPEIKFVTGLDGRKETAFAPVDQVSYNHGSADNIGVITQFMCDALTNTCAANQAAKDLCTRAEAAASAAKPLTGAQADAFNDVFGERTDFASVTPINNTGKPVVR